MRLPAALVLVLGLGACAGAIHQLPQITEADVNRATSEIQNAEGLHVTKRTVAENRAIVMRVAARLQQSAGEICRHVDSPTCRFHVVFDPSLELDAYAHGDNRITITQGLARHLETESEFATVIAHEMGHHMNDHITKLQENAVAGALISGVLFGVIAVGTGAYEVDPTGTADTMNEAMQLGSGLGVLSYSKEHEREADYIAAYIMARAGYDLHDGRMLWAKLTRQSENYETGLFDTHPSGPDRLAAWDVTVMEVERSPDLLPNLIGETDEVLSATTPAVSDGSNVVQKQTKTSSTTKSVNVDSAERPSKPAAP